ncbi:Disease resistance protein [Melia azedarach]|uniref:Disease resistance protein n=1 Tax=Melia azedarach TaxID=155640 RepID=A0ACC1YBV4_MELAZ|nr:Disease resistance protein [Melia azedarach]
MAAELVNAGVSGVASKVAELLFDPIRREISYVFKYQSYVDKLRSQLEVLKNTRQRLEQAIKEAERQGDEAYDDVKQCLSKMNELIERAGKLIDEDEDNAKNKHCFKGLCPDLMARRNLSKQTVNEAKNAVNLLMEVGRFKLDTVSYHRAPERIGIKNAVGDYQQFDSRMEVFQDVMEALQDSKLNMIGVYGMGGVGKTMLIKEVARKVTEEKLFDKVVMAEVTLNPELKSIQDKIAYGLGFTFGQHESVDEKADKLHQWLKKERRVLVILDNIWEELKLEAVGIPFGNDEKEGCSVRQQECNGEERKDGQCTILLTSRSRHVLCNEMNSQKNFLIEVLSFEEAMSLFLKIVGDHSMKTSDFEPLAVDIVEKCGGLPIAIKTIATALKNKSLSFWKDALYRLNNLNPRDIQGMNKNVYSTIELSYDFLESEEAKSMFKLCGLQITGSQLVIDDLIKYGVGLDMFENVYTMEATRNRVCTLIDNLKDSCLLLEDDDENFVSMHDIIHVVALSIAEENLMFNILSVDEWRTVRENVISKDPTVISIACRGGNYQLPERLECSKLKMFGLFLMEDCSLEIPDLLFDGMAELRVLDLTEIHLRSLPSSLGFLSNLRTLCLDWCVFGDADVAIVGQLKNLEILSFCGSDLKQLPREIGQLIQLKLLDLGNCSKLEVIAPGVISKLSQLEELYVDSFTQWEKVGGGSNASLVELMGLSNLTALHIHLLDAQIMQKDLLSMALERFKIVIGDVWGWSNRYYDKSKTSKTLKFSGLDKTIYMGNTMKMLLKRTEALYLDKLNGFQSIVHELDGGGFPRLKHLHVQNNSDILYIINSVEVVHCDTFSLLESLSLSDLINLERICHEQFTECQSFRKLRIIDVKSCHKLQHVFSLSMAQNCLQLQEIHVTDCKNLELIVDEERENHIVCRNESIDFSRLHSLTLKDLPQLTSCTSGFKVEIPRTPSSTTSASKEMVVEDDPEDLKTVLFNNKINFPNLEKLELCSLNIEKIWLDRFSPACQNLTKLIVEKCGGLKFLFSYSMVNSLVGLQELVITGCESMEWVIDSSGLGRDEEQKVELLVFPKLSILELSFLPKLTRFISESSSDENTTLHAETQPLFDEKVGLPCLEVLIIKGADKVRKIWHHQNQHQLALNSFSKLRDLRVFKCGKLMNIFPLNIIIKQRSSGRLEELLVDDCDSLQEIIEEETNCTAEEQEFPTAAVGSRFDVFPQLTKLQLWNLPKLKSIYQGKYTLRWPLLQHLWVYNCEKVEILFGSSELLSRETRTQQPIFLVDHHKARFRGLKALIVSKFPYVEEIWHDQALPFSFFSNLTLLRVSDCKFMSSAIPANLLRFLNNLLQLDVIRCDSVEEVFHLEGLDAGEHTDPLFPRLKFLYLIDLPKLKRFCSFNGNTVELPSLSSLGIHNCNNMETFISDSTDGHETANNESFSADVQALLDEKVVFPRLANLEVRRMHGLRNLVTLSAIENLRKLTSIKITGCAKIENIMEMQVRVGEEVKEDSDNIVFSQLEYLELDSLPSLESFCLGNYTIEFPCLKHVAVRGCPNMKIFSQGVLCTPKLHKLHLTEEACWEGNLNSTVKKLSEEMARFRGLKALIVSKFPYVEEIWHDQALPVSFFSNLTLLRVSDCKFMSSAIPANLLFFLNNLILLDVIRCDSVEEVFHLEGLDAGEHTDPLFPRLKFLFLIDLPKLKRFCSFNGNTVELPSLSSLWIENCPNMGTFISDSVHEHGYETSNNENFATDVLSLFDEKVAFPKLEELKLCKLPKLLHLCIENPRPNNVFQNLKALQLSECCKLEKLMPSWASFQNLTTLAVSRCDGLINLVTLSTAKSLVNLRRMQVADCKMMEEIIHVRDGVQKGCIVFSQLEYLRLGYLPSLTSFCVGNHGLEFPSLEQAIVKECPVFSWRDSITPKLQRLQLTDLEDDGRWEGSLNSTMQKLFEEMSPKD